MPEHNIERLNRAFAITPAPPISVAAVCAVRPDADPRTVAALIAERTQRAREIAECPTSEGWWFDPSRTPSLVRLAIWSSVLRAIDGLDGPTFTAQEEELIRENPRYLGRRIDGRDIEQGV